MVPIDYLCVMGSRARFIEHGLVCVIAFMANPLAPLCSAKNPFSHLRIHRWLYHSGRHVFKHRQASVSHETICAPVIIRMYHNGRDVFVYDRLEDCLKDNCTAGLKGCGCAKVCDRINECQRSILMHHFELSRFLLRIPPRGWLFEFGNKS